MGRPQVDRVRWLLILFVVVPLVELYLLLFIGSQIGFWPTVAIVLVTGLLGASLAKREGLRVLDNYRQALSQGRMPDEGIVGGLLVLVGGVLLITPGMLTDLAGLMLLLPATRRIVAQRIQSVLAKKVDDGVMQVMTVRAPMPGDNDGPGDPIGFGNVYVHTGPLDDPLGPPRRGAGGDVVDTEGVEVQATHLLGPAPHNDDDPKR